MPRRDYYHQSVRTALEKDEWTITDDPLTVPTPGLDFHIDLGAVRDLIGAQKDGDQIAVEIKSLKGNSVFYDYHQAFGQFMMYGLALRMTGKKHLLYLAVPERIPSP
jgi:XisH protein